MNIAVTGATGTLGKAIMFRLREAGYSVVGIGRNQSKITDMKNQNFNCYQKIVKSKRVKIDEW